MFVVPDVPSAYFTRTFATSYPGVVALRFFVYVAEIVEDASIDLPAGIWIFVVFSPEGVTMPPFAI